MKNDSVYQRVTAIHDMALSNLRALKIPPYPAHYKRYFDQIFQAEADMELAEALRQDATVNEKIDSLSKYIELAQLAIESFFQSHSDISRIAELQNDYLNKASEEADKNAGETCVQIVGGLTQLGADMSLELKKADNKIKMLTEKLEETLQEITVDNLTQAYNRKAMVQDLEAILAGGRERELSTVVLMIDADNFKILNDEYGHIAGDKILIYLSQTIKSVIRSVDRVYRYGGEEFVVVLDRCEKKMALNIAEKIRANIENSNLIYNGKTMQVTVSIGATVHRVGDSVDSICERADKALYKAKHQGKNMVVVDGDE